MFGQLDVASQIIANEKTKRLLRLGTLHPLRVQGIRKGAHDVPGQLLEESLLKAQAGQDRSESIHPVGSAEGHAALSQVGHLLQKFVTKIP